MYRKCDFMMDVKRNLATMVDFYELTMSAGYLDEGYENKVSVFDMFFRKVPDGVTLIPIKSIFEVLTILK